MVLAGLQGERSGERNYARAALDKGREELREA
jgi:hypothetical protein